MGAGAAYSAALRGLADLQGLDRTGQPALRLQRRAQYFYRIANPRERAPMGPAGAARGARQDASSAGAGHDPLSPDDAVPGAQARRAALGRKLPARPDSLPVRSWRADRRAANEHPRR